MIQGKFFYAYLHIFYSLSSQGSITVNSNDEKETANDPVYWYTKENMLFKIFFIENVSMRHFTKIYSKLDARKYAFLFIFYQDI